jgi:hypothetical protein
MTLTTKTRRIVAGAIAAAALPVAAIAGAGSAQATTRAGCTINPLTPIYAYTTAAGVKVIDYRISVNCSPNRHAHISQRVYEADTWPNPDDLIATRNFVVGGVTVLDTRVPLPNTEAGREEVFHQVRFWVHANNGAMSGTTAWQNSPVRSFAN